MALSGSFKIINSYDSKKESSIITRPMRIEFANEDACLRVPPDSDDVTLESGKGDWSTLWKIESVDEGAKDDTSSDEQVRFKHFLYGKLKSM